MDRRKASKGNRLFIQGIKPITPATPARRANIP